MTDIYEIKKATLAALERIIMEQQFDAGIKQLLDKGNTVVFTFQTLPGKPDPVVVELMTQLRLFPKDAMLVSSQTYGIRLQHSRRKAADEPNDISLGITEEQFTKFLHLCCPDPKAQPIQLLSPEKQKYLQDTCRLCAREADSIRDIKERLDRFSLSLKPIHAANESLVAGLMKVREACSTLERFLAGVEQAEWQLELHKRHVEDR